MYAIVELNGKDYKVIEGQYVIVDLIHAEADATIDIDNVKMLVDGDNSKIGQPFVEGVKVKAKVLSHFKDKKIIVFKMKRKKGYRRKNGHRQNYTKIQIESIGA